MDSVAALPIPAKPCPTSWVSRSILSTMDSVVPCWLFLSALASSNSYLSDITSPQRLAALSQLPFSENKPPSSLVKIRTPLDLIFAPLPRPGNRIEELGGFTPGFGGIQFLDFETFCVAFLAPVQNDLTFLAGIDFWNAPRNPCAAIVLRLSYTFSRIQMRSFTAGTCSDRI